MSVVAFPDIEAALVAWLPPILAAHGISQHVGTKNPNPRPDQFVKIIRTGGPERNVVVDAPQITVECWGPDDPTAAANARIVRAELASARNVTVANGTLIYGTTEFSGPARLPDESGQSRYTWTVQVWTRGAPLTI